MAHYVALLNYTEQGIRSVKDTVKREKAFRDLAKGVGIAVKDSFWTLGRYDVILTLEAPNDEAVTTLMLKLASLGNVKTQTLRAFSAAEMDAILAKV